MDITISHPDFKTQLLEMRISGYFYAPKILLNGVNVKRVGGSYSVLDDAGDEVTIRLNSSMFNMLPQLFIDQDEIKVSHAGWSQFAGWKKSVPVAWGLIGLNAIRSLLRGRKLNKTIQG